MITLGALSTHLSHEYSPQTHTLKAADDEDEYEANWEEDAEEDAVRWGVDPQGNAVVCNATGPLALADPEDACAPLTSTHGGAVLLAMRGQCTFMTKARHAEKAGAVALIVAQNDAGEEGVVSMRGDEGVWAKRTHFTHSDPRSGVDMNLVIESVYSMLGYTWPSWGRQAPAGMQTRRMRKT